MLGGGRGPSASRARVGLLAISLLLVVSTWSGIGLAQAIPAGSGHSSSPAVGTGVVRFAHGATFPGAPDRAPNFVSAHLAGLVPSSAVHRTPFSPGPIRSGLAGSKVGSPLSATNPYYMQEGGTIAQFTNGAFGGFAGWYINVTLQTSPYPIGYEFNGVTNVGDWYQTVVGYDWPGCNTGFELLYSSWNNAGSNSGGTYCDPSVTLSSGNVVELWLWIDTTSSDSTYQDACMAVTDVTTTYSSNSDCVTQPDGGSTPQNNYFESLTSAANTNGYATGPWTELIDTTSSACTTYTGLPTMTYQFPQMLGLYVTAYIPWSDQFLSGGATCYSSASPDPEIALTISDHTVHYSQEAPSYGPHWESGQNTTATNWVFETDHAPSSPVSLSISESRSTADIGQAVTYTPSASGGTTPYAYHWYLNGVLQTSTTSTWSWTPSAAGTDDVEATVTDASTNTYGYSNEVAVSVSSDPAVGAPTASPASGGIDAGQSVTFTSATPTGGYGSYGYSWTALPTGCTNSGTSTETCSPTAGNTYTVTVQVTDGNGYAVTGSLSYLVDSDPAVGAPTASPVSGGIDVGQTVTFTSAAPSGGSGGYGYSWTSLPTGCTSSAASTDTCTPTAANTYTVTVKVTDSHGVATTGTISYVVVSDPVPSISPSIASGGIDAGQTVVFTGSATGGSGGTVYAWTSLPTGCTNSGAASQSCTPTTAGSFTVTLKATDSNGFAATISITYVVDTDPSMGNPTASPVSGGVDVGQPVTFTSATPSGGSGGYVYAWTSLPTGCSNSAASTDTCTPNTAGAYTVTVQVKDSNGFPVTGSISYSVDSDPTVGNPTASPGSGGVDVGQTVTFTSATPSGGSGGYAYSWTSLPTGCTSSGGSTDSCVPTGSGSFTVTVQVKDSNGFAVTGTITYAVDIDPAVGNPTASPVSGGVDVGQTVTFTSATPSGGSGGYVYSWTSLPTGCTNSGASTDSCVTTTSGTSTVTVQVKDSNGFAVTGTITYAVDSDPVPSISPSIGSGGIDVGQTVTFTGSVTGGSGGTAYSWTSLPTGCTNSAASTDSCTPSTAGSYTVTLKVTDSNSFSATTSIAYSVDGDPTVGNPTASPISGGVDVGQTVTFTSATPSGGSGGYTYSWTSLPTGCTSSGSSTDSCVPTGSGSFTVTVQVKDTNNFAVTGTITYLVESDPVPTVTPSHASGGVDVGQTVWFNATVTGGSGGTSYSWTSLPTGCTNSASATDSCTPSTAGSYTVTLKVTDSNAYSATTSLTYVVDSDPVPSVTPSHPSGAVDVGQTVWFNATVTGGSGGTTYSWTSLPTGCTNSATSSDKCVPTAAGGFTVTLKVTDSNAFSATATLSYTVDSDPAVGNPTASPVSGGIDVTQTVTFTSATPSGGSGGYAYAWSGLPTGCTSSGTATDSCTPTSAGTSTVTVTVKDSNGYAVTGSISYVVDTDPTVGAPTAVPATSGIDSGQPVVFTSATPAGGSGGYTYDWTVLPTGCASSGTATDSCTPSGITTNTSFSVTVKITDSNGFAVTSGALPYQVLSDPTVTLTASSGFVDLTQVLTLTAAVSGGAGGYAFAWTHTPTGCTASNVRVITCTPTATGSFPVDVNVTDGNAFKVIATSVTVKVNQDPTLAESPSAAQSNESGEINNFTATVTLGSTPYTYQWMVNGTAVAGATSAVYAFHPMHPATYTVNVTVRDAAGWVLWGASVTETVYPGPEVTLAVPTTAVDLGATVSYAGSESGGVPPIVLQWFVNSALVQSGGYKDFNFTAAGAAVYTITFQATDADNAHVSQTSTLTVFPDPTVATPTASPASIDSGQSVTFSAVVNGGSGTFTYVWSGLPSGCVSSNSSSIACTPAAVASNTSLAGISVHVSDTLGKSATSGSLTLSEDADPVTGVPTASLPIIDNGQTVTFAVPISGGSGGYAFVWSGLPKGCASANTRPLSCTPSGVLANASTSISVGITDSNGYPVASGSLAYEVLADPTVSVPVAAPASVDNGQSVSFSVSFGEGSGVYNFTWTGLPSGCAPVNSSKIACTVTSVTANTTYTVAVTLRDTLGFSVANTSLTFQVDADPSVVLTSSVSAIDLTQSLTLTAAAASGSGGYSFYWSGLPAGCANANVRILTCTPTAVGPVSVSVSVLDSHGFNVTSSPALALTVNADPTVLVSPGTSQNNESGQFVNFTAAVTAGTAPYNYTWLLNGTAIPGASLSALAFHPLHPGNYTVNATVIDAAGWRLWTPGVTVLVVQGPQIALRGSSAVIDLGTTVGYTATENGGIAPFTFKWFLNTTLQQSGTNLTWNFTALGAGNYSITVEVVDAQHAQVSSTLLLLVHPDPRVNAPGAAPASVDLSQSTTFSVTPSGGTGVYSLVWVGLPSGCSTLNMTSVSCAPSATGSFSVQVNVTDTLGKWSLGPALSFTVYADPVITTPTATPSLIDATQSVTFQASASLGSGGNTYQWSGLPAGCVSSSTLTLTCSTAVIAANTTFDVVVTVTDSNGLAVPSAVLAFVEHAAPGAVLGVSSSNPTVGVAFYLNTSITGGSAPYVLSFSGLPTGCAAVSSPVLRCIPTGAGTYSVHLSLRDSLGVYANVTKMITVGSPGPHPLTLSVTLSQTTVTEGQKVWINSTVSGGTAPYTFVYVGLPSGCSSANVEPLVCAPQVSGTFSITVNATDGLKDYGQRTVSLTVSSGAPPLAVSLAASETSVPTGTLFTLTATATGGVAPYSYSWSLNGTADGSAPDRAVWNLTLDHAGTYVFEISVLDAHGKSATSSVTVTVTPAKPQGGPTGGGFPWWILLVVAAVIVALLLLVVLRRRSEKKAPAEEPAPSEGGALSPAPEAFASGGAEPLPPPPEPMLETPGAMAFEGTGMAVAGAEVAASAPEVSPDTSGEPSVPAMDTPPAPEAEAVPPPPPPPPAASGSEGARRCFVCGSELQGNFCPSCNMSWDEPG